MDSRRQEEDDEGEGCPCGGAIEAVDHFDRLHNTVLLDVLIRIGAVKALGRFALVSRRFYDLVPLIDSVFVRVDCIIPDNRPPSSSSALWHNSPRPHPRPPRAAVASPARALLPSRRPCV